MEREEERKGRGGKRKERQGADSKFGDRKCSNHFYNHCFGSLLSRHTLTIDPTRKK